MLQHLGYLMALVFLAVGCFAQPANITAIRVIGSLPDGSTVLPAEEITAVMQAKVGSPYDEEQLSRDAEAIQSLYERKGYPLARVVGYEHLPDGTLVVRIAEGKISAIRVVGNRRTRAASLLRYLSIRPGQIYALPVVQRERERLGKLRFLKEVQIAPEPADEVGQVVLRVSVEELNTTQVAAAVGYASGRGLLGYLEFSDLNLFGGGQQIQAQWQRGTYLYEGAPEDGDQRQAYLVRYYDPAFATTGIILAFSAYHLDTLIRPTFSQSVITLRSFERRQGYTVGVGYQWRDRWQTLLTLRSDRVDYDDAPANLLSLGQKAANRGRVFAPGLQVRYDTRDNPQDPRTGAVVLASWESAQRGGGGDFSFDRVTIDARSYWPARGGSTLATRLMMGTSRGDLPLSENFWLGGFDLRGYEFDAFRGEQMVLFTTEWRVPLLEGVQGAVFVDVGDAWTRSEGLRLNVGGGFGLRFLTPFGTIRLDVAAGKQKVFTYMTLGQSF